MTESLQGFEARRARGNEAILEGAPLPIKRFFALDHDAYEAGALSRKTKELLGLVASTVLRCDDCVTHHLRGALDAGATREELIEALGISLVVGGSITVPHLRFAWELLDGLLRVGGPEDEGT